MSTHCLQTHTCRYCLIRKHKRGMHLHAGSTWVLLHVILGGGQLWMLEGWKGVEGL